MDVIEWFKALGFIMVAMVGLSFAFGFGYCLIMMAISKKEDL